MNDKGFRVLGGRFALPYLIFKKNLFKNGAVEMFRHEEYKFCAFFCIHDMKERCPSRWHVDPRISKAFDPHKF
jgi:hypothetical protein